MQKPCYTEVKDLVLGELSVSLGSVREEEVEQLIETVLSSRKAFFVGVGRVLLSLQAIAKRGRRCFRPRSRKKPAGSAQRWCISVRIQTAG